MASVTEFVAWVQGAGWIGVVVYMLIYTASTAIGLPATPFSLAAGFLWGTLLGAAVIAPSATLGAVGAFLIGRFLFRNRVQRYVARYAKFDAVNRAIEQGGLGAVVLVRLSPLFPFNALNYGLGLSRLRLRDYALGTLVGISPGCLLFAYVGAGLQTFTTDVDTGVGGQALFWTGLLATFGVVTWVSRLARRQLEDLTNTADATQVSDNATAVSGL
jgi:uncharacterized membrane protein YdjX (TVP38/TMEM64 family)